MTDVFISYAHEDQAFVRRMVPALEAEGLSVWWDHTIPPGRTWSNYIATGIEEAKSCIVVWSEHSVASKWVLEEASIANDADKLLPVAASNVKPPMGYRSMQAAQLTDWNGDTQHPQWRLLVNEVRRISSGQGRTAATANAQPSQMQARPAPAYTPPPAGSAPTTAKKPPWPMIGGGVVIGVLVLALIWSAQSRMPTTTYDPSADPAAAAAEAPAEAPADPAALPAPSGTLPTNFDIGSARQALAGNNQALMSAFVFDGSPQGHAYWYALSQSSAPLPAEARLQLQQWIAIASAASTASWRGIAGDWQLTANLRGNTCSAYYRFIDRGTYLQWYTGTDAASLNEQTSGGAFSDMGGGRIFYAGYDDQYFQVIGGDLIRTDSQGNRYCTFTRVMMTTP